MAQASFAYSTPAPAALLPSYPWPRGMRRPTRADIESLIEGLISFLDDLDGDADLEQEEPDGCAREWHGQGAHRYDVGLAA